jgi:hypothetical protein
MAGLKDLRMLLMVTVIFFGILLFVLSTPPEESLSVFSYFKKTDVSKQYVERHHT